MMSIKGVILDESRNKSEVNEPVEVHVDSENERLPTATSKSPSEPGSPTGIVYSIMKKLQISEAKEEEIFPMKKTVSKSRNPSPAPIRVQESVTEVNVKEEPEKNQQFYDENDIESTDEEEVEEKLYQGPGTIPSKPFTSGAFVVLKTDMIGDHNPPIWKIDGKELLQKYISFNQNDKILYKNTRIYSSWSKFFKDQYYSAPVSFIKQTSKEHIIEFYKDKIQKDP